MTPDERRRAGRSGLGFRFRSLDRPTRRFVAHLAILGGLLLLWWGFASLLMPELLRLTHEGRDLPILSQLMVGRETTPLEAYLETWAGIARGIALMLVMFVALSLPFAFTLPRVADRLERPDFRFTDRAVGLLWAGGLLVLTAAVLALGHVAPVAYVYAITEDYWVEHATFVAFMLAGGLFVWAAVLQPGLRTLGPLGFALAAFLVGLEEVSWGQRIVGFDTPELLEAYNYQGELTLHNIWFPRHTAVGLVVVLFGVALPPLARRWEGLGNLLRRMAVPLPRLPLRALFLVAGTLLVASVYVPAYLKLDEVAELALGVAVLVLALDLAIRAGTAGPPGARVAFLSGAGSLAVVLVVTGGLVYLAPSPDGLRWRLNDFAAHRYPEAGMYGQAETLFRYLDRNPEWQDPSTHLEYGRLLLELGETERAREVLDQAMERQRARLAEIPEALPDARRIEAEAHLLLGRPARAEQALGEALAADRALLAELEDEADRAMVYWSLALTAEVSGDERAAFRHAARACELAEERTLRLRIEYWAERLLQESDLSGEVPNPCPEEGLPI